jgi:hypothetical protein
LYSFPNIIRQFQVKESEVGGACGTHMGREKCTHFWWECSNERDHLEDQGIDGREDGNRMDLKEIGWGCRVDSVG